MDIEYEDLIYYQFFFFWLSLNSTSISIVINVRKHRFECAKTHYLFIYKLEGVIDNSKQCIKKQIWSELTRLLKENCLSLYNSYNKIVKKYLKVKTLIIVEENQRLILFKR